MSIRVHCNREEGRGYRRLFMADLKLLKMRIMATDSIRIISSNITSSSIKDTGTIMVMLTAMKDTTGRQCWISHLKDNIMAIIMTTIKHSSSSSSSSSSTPEITTT